MDEILRGIEDVPKINDGECYYCKTEFNSSNFDGWYMFIESHGQMYQVPTCNDCSNTTDITKKSEEE